MPVFIYTLSNVYLYTQWLKPPVKNNVQNHLHHLQAYMNMVIHDEWPLMEDFKPVSQEGDFMIKQMFKDLLEIAPANQQKPLSCKIY